jgi:hypothetical protein
MNDTDAQTKGRSPDEVSPVATALKEARAVMTNISEIHAPEDSRFPCQEDIFAWIPCWVRSQGILSDTYADMSEGPDGSTTFLERHRTNQFLRGVSPCLNSSL